MTGGTLVGCRLADRAVMPSLYGGLVAVMVVLGTFGWLAGAWLGSIVLAAGYGYEWPSRVGAVLAVAGLLLALVSGLMDRRARAGRPETTSLPGERVP